MKKLAVLTGVLTLILTACTPSPRVTSKQPKWALSPSQPTYFINSVAVSADGNRVVGGTFYHDYSSSTSTTARRSGKVEKSTNDDQSGRFGTYCYNQDGQLLWKDEFDGWQGTYWVDISSDGAFAASGGWYSKDPYAGFVRAFDAGSGKMLLNFPTASRVNQVALSSDGTWLVSAAETLVLFKRGADNSYTQVAGFDPKIDDPDQQSKDDDSVETAGISADGKRVICGTYNHRLCVFNNNSGTLDRAAQWSLSSSYSHCIRLTPDGSAFVAGGPSGFVYYFDIAQFIQTGQPTAQYQCTSKSAVYGVAVADDGSAFVGVSNLNTNNGQVSFVKRNGTQTALVWDHQLERNPNCASLNLEHNQLAIADGHPNKTPGHFTLFEAATGKVLWQYTTSTDMSWPIMIARSGSAIVGGSDDSHLYYFTP